MLKDQDESILNQYCWRCATKLEAGSNRIIAHGEIDPDGGSDLVMYCPDCKRVAAILRAPSAPPSESDVGHTL